MLRQLSIADTHNMLSKTMQALLLSKTPFVVLFLGIKA
jgi:hypothetical protein